MPRNRRSSAVFSWPEVGGNDKVAAPWSNRAAGAALPRNTAV